MASESVPRRIWNSMGSRRSAQDARQSSAGPPADALRGVQDEIRGNSQGHREVQEGRGEVRPTCGQGVRATR